jgi:hypothetical protein
MSDVGAIALTLGEQTTARALTSLREQTLPVEDVVIVDGVRPFHRAFNSGAERVSTPFFVQVDADMILDPDCVETLRGAMASGVGIAVGALRDPLVGPIAGVKMFRRSCVETLPLQDAVGPEIDQYVRLAGLGWQTRCLTGRGLPSARGATLGEHRPDYAVDYVFGTYYLLGRIYAHLQDARGLRWRLGRLRRSAHPAAPVARVAMARGVLGNETSDVSKPHPGPAESAFLRRLTATSPDDTLTMDSMSRLTELAGEPPFAAFHELGRSLRASPAGVRGALRALGEIDHSRSLLAEVALGGGALAEPRQPAWGGAPAALSRLANAWEADDPVDRAA